MRVVIRWVFAGAAMLGVIAPAAADWQPQRPIAIMVGFAPGGTSAVAAHILS